MGTSIRTAAIEDSETIALLSGQLGYTTSKENMKDRLLYLLAAEDHCVYVATVDAKITGWIHAQHTSTVESDPWVEIAGLVVDEEYRSMGIGRILVQTVIDWALTRGVQKARLRSNVIRKDAHRFYTNFGFKEIKQQKVFEIMLNKNIRP